MTKGNNGNRAGKSIYTKFSRMNIKSQADRRTVQIVQQGHYTLALHLNDRLDADAIATGAIAAAAAAEEEAEEAAGEDIAEVHNAAGEYTGI